MNISIKPPLDRRPACGTVSWEGHSTQFDGDVPPHLPTPVQMAIGRYIRDAKDTATHYQLVVTEVQ